MEWQDQVMVRRVHAHLAVLASLTLVSTIACTDDEGAQTSTSDSLTDSSSGDGDGTTEGSGDGDGDASGDGDGDANPAARPNWHEDIAPLVHGSCGGCHQAGGIAPMALDSYEAASVWASLALDAIEAGAMPPWGAAQTDRCTHEHTWVEDLTLSAEDQAMFAEWIDIGTPEGDPANAAPLPEPPNLELEGISGTFQNGSDYELAGVSDDYVCFSIDLDLNETKYLDGVQMLPDNREVVHHVLVWITEDAPNNHPGPYPCFATPKVPLDQAKLVSIWVPGSPPTELPEDVSVEVPPGSHVVLAYHYHSPGAGPYVDRSSVALRWRDEPTPWLGEFVLLGITPSAPELTDPPFLIPAGATGHRETIGVPWTDGDAKVFSAATHMHYVGRDQIIGIQRPGQEPAESDCLLHTPDWDFNWQRFYDIDAPIQAMPTLTNQDTVWMDCEFDNTLDNPGVAQALNEQGLSEPLDIGWGEGSLDEMCLAMLGVAYEQ